MPHLVSPLSVKKMAELQPGELYLYNPGIGPALCLLLDREEQTTFYTALKGEGFQPFNLESHRESGTVLSYGTDWIIQIEALDETEFDNYPTHRRNPGNFVMDEDYSGIEIAENKGIIRHQIYCFDLKSNSLKTTSRHGTNFAWSIWATNEDRLRPGAEPIFRFAPPTDQTSPAS